LGCMGEIDRCRTIVGSGTSADTQLAIFEACQKDESRVHALSAVTDWIANATLQ
jgi:carboxylate-amine ligase